MSTFESDLEDNSNLDNETIGLCGYGSGAKAKVFEGKVSPKWREVTSRWMLFERLAEELLSMPKCTNHCTRELKRKCHRAARRIYPTRNWG